MRAGSNSWTNEPTDRTVGACTQIDARGSSWAPLFVHLLRTSSSSPHPSYNPSFSFTEDPGTGKKGGEIERDIGRQEEERRKRRR